MFNTSVSKRKGKPIKRRRTKPLTSTDSHEISLTLEDARDYVYSYKRSEGLREKTLNDYQKIQNYFIDWLDEFHPKVIYINEVTSGMIRQYVNHLQDDYFNQRTKDYGLSPSTINIRLRNMGAFFNVLHREKVINDNPMALIKLLKTDEDTFQPLTEDEIDRLLKVPDIREYAQFRDLVGMYLILDTGIRVSEMFDLKIKHVDFKVRSIYLSGEITKNRKPRILPLSNKVLSLLMELITEVKYNWDTEYVFVSNFGEKYLTTSFRRRLDLYKKRANIDKRVTPHGLRHQFCRDYIMNGGDVFTLQRIAGHADINTTRKYIQFTNDDLKAKHAQFSPIAKRRKKYRNR